MVDSPAAHAVFDFENILPQLDFLPIAARRALDHAGLRLSLEAWRSLGLDDRCQLVAAGANDIVDAGVVAGVVRRASPPAQRIEIVGDPDPLSPPDGLARLLEPVPLDARQWARLRALDRYALAHVHRRSIARNDPTLIQVAYEDIVTGHLRSLRPAPGDAGGSLSPPGMAVVPPPPPLPRVEAVRTPREQRPITPRPVPQALAPRVPDLSFNAPLTLSDDEPTPPSQRVQIPEQALHRPPLPEQPPVVVARPAPRAVIPDLAPPAPPLSSHLNAQGEARMVDVGSKPVTERSATATAVVRVRRETYRRLTQGDTPKGDVLAVARIAGIQAAKRTSELIPLCHAIALTSVEVGLELDAATGSVIITATAEARDRTGVEMEALVAASVAGLTIYDMLKGIDRDITISDVKLLEKKGGRTGHYQRGDA